MNKILAVLLALAALLAGQTVVASAAAPDERLDELQETSYQDALGGDGMQSEIQITGYLVLDLPEETTQENAAENPTDTAAPSPTPNSVSQDASSAVLEVEKLPKTGEQMETALYLAMILVLGSALMILLCLLLRRDEPEEQERTAAPD